MNKETVTINLEDIESIFNVYGGSGIPIGYGVAICGQQPIRLEVDAKRSLIWVGYSPFANTELNFTYKEFKALHLLLGNK